MCIHEWSLLGIAGCLVVFIAAAYLFIYLSKFATVELIAKKAAKRLREQGYTADDVEKAVEDGRIDGQ